MANPIILAPYDAAWPTLFAREAALLRAALPDSVFAGVEHIGSTAIPGLAAKPIVDIVLGLRASTPAPTSDFWSRLGYEVGHPDDHSDDWRYYVKRGHDGARIAHLHVVDYDGMHWQRWIRFRDRLRSEPELAREYLKLKRNLAGRYRFDRIKYTFDKARFIAHAIAPWNADLADVALRPALPSDRAFIERIYFDTQRWIIEELFGWRGDDIERAKFDETYARESTVIISLRGHDIGWMTVLSEATRLELDSIYLAEAYQRMGIGTLLIERLIREAASANVPVTLSTAKINPARTLYKRLGFQDAGESEFKVFLERPAKGESIVRE